MVNTRILIFLFLIVCSIVKCSVYSDCENGVNPSEKNECVDRIDKDKKEQGYHCCFRKNYEYDGTTNYECDLLESDEYDDIEGYIEDEKSDDTSKKDIKLECYQSNLKLYKSQYIQFALMNLFLFLIIM